MISLLNALYSGQEPISVLDRERTLQEIELFAMQAQIHHLLLQRPGHDDDLPMDIRQSLKTGYDKAAVQNLVFQYTERQILRCFDEHQIMAMPLKGTRFAERFFGSVAARATSDVDLFVQPSDLERSIKLVAEMGFQLDKKVHNHAILYKPITPTIPLMIELHWSMDKPYLSELQDAPFWNSSLPMSGFNYIRELDEKSTFYFMILHGMRHRMDSPRYLVDIAQILFSHGDSVDLEALVERAKADLTFKRVQAALSIVYKQFPRLHSLRPLPFPEIETYWTYESVCDRKLGKRRLDDYKNRMFFRFGIFDTWKHQFLSQQPVYRRLGKHQAEHSTKEIPYG